MQQTNIPPPQRGYVNSTVGNPRASQSGAQQGAQRGYVNSTVGNRLEAKPGAPQGQKTTNVDLTELKTTIMNTITNIQQKYDLDNLGAFEPSEVLKEAYNSIESLQNNIILYIKEIIKRKSKDSSTSKSQLEDFKRLFSKSINTLNVIIQELSKGE